MTHDTLRLGILGAARIASMAIIAPAHRVDEVDIVCVAARDRGRAQAFARKHGIPGVAASYDEMLADPSGALEAGKHVLCEKLYRAAGLPLRGLGDSSVNHLELLHRAAEADRRALDGAPHVRAITRGAGEHVLQLAHVAAGPEPARVG